MLSTIRKNKDYLRPMVSLLVWVIVLFSGSRPVMAQNKVMGELELEGKTKVEMLGHFLEPFRGILRIVLWIVAADTNEAKLAVRIVLSNPGNLHLDMHDIGTMPTEEHDQQS